MVKHNSCFQVINSKHLKVFQQLLPESTETWMFEWCIILQNSINNLFMQAKGLTSCKREKIEIFLEFSALQIKSGVYRIPSKIYDVQSWTKGCRQIHEIKQNRFFYEMFCSWYFGIFYWKTSKLDFWVTGWVLAIKSKHFRDFLRS